jgi:dipeptidyl aminopeptidase/acylaminoacyl peptidase
MRVLGICAAVALMLAALAPAPGRAMVPEDILSIRTTQVVDLSPDGRYLLYAVGTWNQKAASWQQTVFRRDLDTGDDLVVFTPEDRSRGAVFRPDGRAIAYLRQGDAGSEIWAMAADGSDRKRLSAGAGSFGSLHWAPDGTALAWVASAEVGHHEGVAGQYIVADHLGYRHLGDGYRRGRLGQLFAMDLANGQARRLVDGPLDVRSVSWSPDSRELVFEAKADTNLGLNLNTDLFVVGRGGGPVRQLTTNPGMDSAPRWLKGGLIAWMRGTEPIWESSPRTIAVMAPETGDSGPLKEHGTALDAFFWRWTEHEGSFLALAANGGALDLVSLEGGSQRWLTDFQHDFWSVHAGGRRAVLQGASQTSPGAIYVVDLTEKTMGPHLPRTVVDPNQAWCNRVGLTEPEAFTVEVDGRTIEGWYFPPEGLIPGQPAPLVLSIHGGPEWMYGGYFLPEFHILPSFGYGVLIANPTGSLGYGIEFQQAIRHDWVDRPAREVLACVDWAIARGLADPQGLAVMGGSFGGLLTAELTTQTGRFQAAAIDRMYPDQITFWGTTDEKWFPEWEFGGKPWDPGAREIYERNSPWLRVDRVNTPTLISQGHLDYRCLAAGGQMWFSALKARGVPTRFIRFENEGHGLRDPRNQVFYQHQLLGWFETHLLPVDETHGDILPHD